jgi:putative ABC transport system permease protein
MDTIVHLIRLTLRSFFRNRFYSITIILGFSIAITVCYLIMGLLIHENSIDDFHTKRDRIFRVMMKDPIAYVPSYFTYHELHERLQTDYPEIEVVSHLAYPGWRYVREGKNKFQEKKILYADTNFFKVFDYQIIQGDRSSALTNPYSVVLSHSTANKYFGTREAIGQNLYLEDQPYTVTAIVDNATGTSHLQFDMLISANVLPVPQNPLDGGGFTYIVLKNTSDADRLVDKLNSDLRNLLSWNYQTPQTAIFQLQSLKDCYFSNVQYGESTVLIAQDWIFLERAGFAMLIIIFIAAFNFVNFSQAKALFRSKEIIILSIFGSGKQVVLLQFIIEAILLCVTSLFISVMVILLTLPFFNEVTGISLDINFMLSPMLLGTMGGITLFLSVVLGIIVYYLFARVHTNSLIKGVVPVKTNFIKALNGLIVIQIATSVTLMLLNTAIWKQMDFVNDKTLGSSKESIIEINLLELPREVNPTVIKTEIMKYPEVITASVCMGIPLDGRGTHGFEVKGKTVELNWMMGDLDYIEAVGYEIIKGRSFRILADTNYVVLNETAMKLYGMSENFEFEDPNAPKNVIGIVKDFHFKSLHEQIDPVTITLINPRKVNVFGAFKLLVKAYGDSEDILQKLEVQWKNHFPDVPFEYSFINEKYQSIYKKDRGHATLMMVGSIASTIITLFGLVGLSVYTTYRRSKEIAIRKVYGASSNTILILFIKQITTWTMISSVIAVPFAVYLIGEWMNDFAYRTTVPWYIYFEVVLGATLLITVSILYQATISSFKNPAKALRND